MNIRTLMAEIEQPDVQRALLADYQGPYSIGIGPDPREPVKSVLHPVVIVRVSHKDSIHPPRSIKVEGEDVPVVVQGGYDAPRPLRYRAA